MGPACPGVLPGPQEFGGWDLAFSAGSCLAGALCGEPLQAPKERQAACPAYLAGRVVRLLTCSENDAEKNHRCESVSVSISGLSTNCIDTPKAGRRRFRR